MARNARNYRSDAQTQDKYQEITDRLVAALEDFLDGKRAKLPWQKPWKAVGLRPQNGHSGHVYNGINVLLTQMSGFGDHRWYTFNQVASGDYGQSHVKKGSKGTHIIKWLFLDKTEKTEKDGVEVEKTRKIPVLRTYVVFNHEQIEWEEGKEPMLPEVPMVDPTVTCAQAEEFFARQGATVRHGGDRACYSPSMDVMNLPFPGTFNTVADYEATKAHEFIHWTGHKSRCNRNLGGRFGSSDYAFEELVAEIGAAFLCDDLGIEAPGLDTQHQAYLESWIDCLKKDKYAIFTAARLAREAVGFLTGQAADEMEENEEAA